MPNDLGGYIFYVLFVLLAKDVVEKSTGKWQQKTKANISLAIGVSYSDAERGYYF